MSKVSLKSGALLAPLPVVLVGCGTVEKPNALTVAWTGIVNSDPPMTYVSVRPSRYSHRLIEESGEFTINLPSGNMTRTLDSCGVLTGAKVDKFKKFSLEAVKGTKVEAPIIANCPVSLECKVSQKLSLGSHDMFLATIEAVIVDEELIDEKGKLRLDKAHLVCYSHGDYIALGKKIGSFGYSVRKHRTKKDGKKK